MRTTTVVTALVRIVVPKMLRVKCCAQCHAYTTVLVLYTRTAAVVVDAHNEVPDILIAGVIRTM